MNPLIRKLLAGAALLLLPGSAVAQMKDHLVQAPQLSKPEAGSVAGSLSRLAFGPADLPRGTYGLPLPVEVPQERGPLLAQVLPRYSPEGGLSEWGLGWQSDLSLQRYRVVGDLDFTADGYTSPWGRLRQGVDGRWYPSGLSARVRLTQEPTRWVAEQEDGSLHAFNNADAITSPKGTYAWMLSEVTTLGGDRTVLTYERNASGRPFLKTVQYGGRGGTLQYEVELVYELLPQAFEDHRSGAGLLLDRRVSQVRVKARPAGVGAFETRWTYQLAYTQSRVGPAFYLASVTKVHRSGESEPPVSYAYDDGKETLDTGTLQVVPALDSYLASAGSQALQPDKMTITDVEEDGLLDMEHQYKFALVRQTPTGWVTENLPPATGTENVYCRPPPSTANKPRTLARMTAGATEPQVVHTRPDGTTGFSWVLICNRPGQKLYEGRFSGAWQQGPNTRMVDLNRDLQPDFVRLFSGGYEVLENVSSPTGYGFLRRSAVSLSPAFTPTATYVHDFNGDGLPDLIGRSSTGVTVWYGQGGFKFANPGRSFPFRNADGTPFTLLADHQLSFVDSNRDGLTDVLLSRGRVLHLFANQGERFVLTSVPGLTGMDFDFGYPVIADLSGRGHTEAMFVKLGRAYAFAFSQPGTGLLKSANDGKGTVVDFAYQRAAPAVGLGGRPAVLARTTSRTSGYAPVSHDYTFSEPRMHSLGKFLIGFAQVRKSSPLLVDDAVLHHDDDISAQPVSSTQRDSSTPFLRFSETTYEEATLQGIRFRRPVLQRAGARRLDGTRELATQTRYLAYQRGTCPTHVETTNAHGTLNRQITLASVAGLDDALHCLTGWETVEGTHANPALDFLHTQQISRNALGQVESVTAHGSDGPLVLQQVTYDSLHRVQSVSVPGKGGIQVSYAPDTGVLRETIGPDGVVQRVSEFDPMSDAFRVLFSDRGAGGQLTGQFRYDGLERLHKSWDDLGGSSETRPAEELLYQYPTLDQPGLVQTRVLLDAAGTYKEAARALAGDGESLASLERMPGGWAVTRLSVVDPSQKETQALRRDLLPVPTLAGLTHGDLRAGAVTLSLQRSSGLGRPSQAWSAVQDGVARELTTSAVLDERGIVSTVSENGGNPVQSAEDDRGNLLWSKDALGAATSFQYDVLGRRVGVQLADGKRQSIHYDSYGRPAQLWREDLTLITYHYRPGTGLPTEKRIHQSSGSLERTVRWTHDAIGRPLTETHELATGGTRVYAFDYDGQIPGEPLVPGQRGRLTRVRTDGYERRMVYEPDGALRQVKTVFPGWRTVIRDIDYRPDRNIRGETWSVRNAAGTELQRIRTDQSLDAWGRERALVVDGVELVQLTRDSEGRLARADMPGGESLTPQYDALTRRPRGYQKSGGAWSGSVSWNLGPRGLVESEDISVGTETRRRAYQYDGRRFLTQSDDGVELARYAYGVSGLPEEITDSTGVRSVRHLDNRSLVTGDYEYDVLGRVKRKGDLALEYGPTGQIERASRPGRSWEYRYDESGQRVLKVEGGAPVAAFLGDAYLTADRLVLPVMASERLLGVLDNGVFQSVAADPRGTLVAESGSVNLASPYGVRGARPGLAAALDFVERGYDADLDTVRMGVRDYDPAISQFWSPDPLFLESLDECAQSPTECNLYSYAGNDPILHVDPAGTKKYVEGSFDPEERYPLLKQFSPTSYSYAKVALKEFEQHPFRRTYATWMTLVANSNLYVKDGDYSLTLGGKKEDFVQILGKKVTDSLVGHVQDEVIKAIGLETIGGYISVIQTMEQVYKALDEDNKHRVVRNWNSQEVWDIKLRLVRTLIAEANKDPIFNLCHDCSNVGKRLIFLENFRKDFLKSADVVTAADDLERALRERKQGYREGPSIRPAR